MRRDHEDIATVTLCSEGHTATFSCLFERAPEFLTFNRMSLLGVREDWVRFLPFGHGELLSWTVHEDPLWFKRQGSDRGRSSFGTAFVSSDGMASGVAIDESTIQRFASLEVISFEERHSFVSDESCAPSTEFFFLQRPADWRAYGRRCKRPTWLVQRGDWHQVNNLRFRLVSLGQLRDDRRVSEEVELIDLPGVEITPRAEMDLKAFDDSADDLWFCFRILLSFRYRQLVAPLSVHRRRAGEVWSSWSSVAVEPRPARSDTSDPIFHGPPGPFFAKAAKVLLRNKDQRELIHAAAFGYAASFNHSLLEGRITSCVEAIERLVGAFESLEGLERAIIPRKQWRKVGAALRNAVEGHGLSREQLARLKRSLAAPATITLQDRIERMIRYYRRYWSRSDQQIAAGLNSMIKTRNDIVHGRMVADHQLLHTEIMRSRVLFERLLFSFLGCHQYRGSGHARWMIEAQDREKTQ